MKIQLPNTRNSRIMTGLAVLAAACAIDGLLIEPNWIEVTHHSVRAPISQPLKIAHLTDLHSQGLGFRERRLLELLAREKPDLILITGDTVSSSGRYEGESHLLRQLRAPLGVWLVRGNWENRFALRNENDFYRANGVHFLLDRSVEIQPGVWLIGFNDTAFLPVRTLKKLSRRCPTMCTVSRYFTVQRSFPNPQDDTTLPSPGIRMADRFACLLGTALAAGRSRSLRPRLV
jgi:Calcineurin-like phosphoesterase